MNGGGVSVSYHEAKQPCEARTEVLRSSTFQGTCSAEHILSKSFNAISVCQNAAIRDIPLLFVNPGATDDPKPCRGT